MIDISVYLDKRRLTERGYPVKLRIKQGRASTLVSTGLYTFNDFQDGEFSRQDPDYRIKKMNLNAIRNQLYEASLKLGELELDAKGLKDFFTRELKGERQKGFLDYAHDFMETKEKWGTWSGYDTMCKKVEEFDRFVMLDDVTEDWLNKWESWMKKQGYRPNYYGKLERNIRTVMYYCIKHRYTTNNPFLWFKCKSERTVKRNLTVEQLRQLRDFPVQPYQEEYRDMFMLMVYMMGISPVDLFTMPLPMEMKGKTWPKEIIIDYKRTKIGDKDAGYVKVRLEPEALEIIRKYKGKTHLLNVVEDRCQDYRDYLKRMNNGLKAIGTMTRSGRGGKKTIDRLFPELTAYWARHTWATLAAKCHITKDEVGKALGHADAKVADIYMDYGDDMVWWANRKVLNYIQGVLEPEG